MKPIVVITGISGRIGSSLAKRLAPNYQVYGLDIVPLHEPISGVEYLNTDLSSQESIEKSMAILLSRSNGKIASFVHLAAYYNFTGGAWDLYESITINGTRRLLKELKKFELDQFIFTSTMLVHAPCQLGQTIDEKWPVVPKWEYPRSKVITEKLLHQERGKSSLLILRIAGVYDDYCHSIPISNQIQRIYDNKFESHFYPGHLSHGASFVHMDDLVTLLIRAIEKRQDLPEEEILLVGEEKTLSYRDLQESIGKLVHGKRWSTVRIPKIAAKCGALVLGEKSFIRPWMIDLADDHFALNINRAKQSLSWAPRHSLEASLPLMVNELKKNPDQWFKAHGLDKFR